MTSASKTSPGAIAVGVALGATSLLLWICLVPLLASLDGSDAAGNALAQAYAAVAILGLWGLLALLALTAWIKGDAGAPAALAALVIIPGSCWAALAAVDLLARPDAPPYLWPIVVPAVVPPLVIAFGARALVPSLRAAVRPGVAAGVVWGAATIIAGSILPMSQMRHFADQQEAARRATLAQDYVRLPPVASLWQLTPFLRTRDETMRSAVLDRIRGLGERQGQAEIMLDRGDFPLGFLGQLDLDPTPSICARARDLLRRRVAPLVLTSPGSAPFSAIWVEVADALAAMTWLVGYGCACDAELLAWETMANGYRDPTFDVVELARLRAPEALGRERREHPARFSMLTSDSPLKAWLRFAEDPAWRAQALAGARTLDRRTSDAVAMLTDPYDDAAPPTVLKYRNGSVSGTLW